MMDFVNGIDRNQLTMIDFEAHVAFDSWARIVDLFVDMLPCEEKQLRFKSNINKWILSTISPKMFYLYIMELPEFYKYFPDESTCCQILRCSIKT